MENIKQQIDIDFLAAFKSGKKELKTTLGMIKTAITEGEKLEGKNLSNEEILVIVQSYDKTLDKAIELIEKNGRLANKEKEEKEFISIYLPKQMSESEINWKLDNLIPSIDITNKNKAVGSIMGHFKQNYNGLYNPSMLKSLIDSKLK